MSSPIVRTIGTAEVHEAIEFVTKEKLYPGDTVSLKPQKPITAPVYGSAQVTAYLGPGRDQGHRRYQAFRIN